MAWTSHEWVRKAGEPYTALWFAWRLVGAFAVVGWVSLFYFSASGATADRSHDLSTFIDRSVPFIPWTWWIYFPGYLFGILFSVLAIRSDDVFFRSVGAIMVAQMVNSAVYLVLPSTYPRPLGWDGTGLTADAIRWFWTIDPPNNTFPSSHVCIAVLCWLAMWRDKNRFAWVPLLTAIGVIVTIHTAKQHYWIDAVGGIAVALLTHRLAFMRRVASDGSQTASPA